QHADQSPEERRGEGGGQRFALAFSSPEFFAVYLLAFCTFIGMSRNPPLKTLVAMTIGFAMAAVGMDTVSGDLRLTF
ncbi:tripartite tricarboxylate transporter permease, partial [Pseudomonas aeruginosa]